MKDEPLLFSIARLALALALRVKLEGWYARRTLLAPETRYDRWAGDYDLSAPVERPVDTAVRDACRRFAAARPRARANRTSASADDFYTLMHFARRCAVFALRERRTDFVVDGLTAMATLDPRQVDFRDIDSPLAMLVYAARAIGANAAGLFTTAASLARPDMAVVFERVLQRPERNIRDIGYAVVETPAGLGLIDAEWRPYFPTVPLDRVALDVANAIGTGGYERGRVRIATDPPISWLARVDKNAFELARRRIRAVAAFHADFWPTAQANGGREQHTVQVSVMETVEPSSAETLQRIAEAEGASRPDTAYLAVRVEQLFCLLVARSIVRGVPSFETPQTLRRFEQPVADVLRRYAAAS